MFLFSFFLMFPVFRFFVCMYVDVCLSVCLFVLTMDDENGLEDNSCDYEVSFSASILRIEYSCFSTFI